MDAGCGEVRSLREAFPAALGTKAQIITYNPLFFRATASAPSLNHRHLELFVFISKPGKISPGRIVFEDVTLFGFLR